MRIDRKLFDFCLNVVGEFIYVHKIALAIASPYFAAMFESQSIKESAKQHFITFIDDVQETSVGYLKLDAGIIALKVLVDYVYSGIIMVTEENVEGLLAASNLFQFTWVKEQCEKFLKKSMNSTNCFRIRKFADMHPLKDLHDYSHKYILNNFDNLINEEELLLLPFEQFENVKP
ncbi:hypothetical protein GQX74_004859 [Glossina fuscipes]|nr:hypothetical protein GQX74_004859 [Glossina fuscipes]